MNTSDPAVRVLTGLVHDMRSPLQVMTLKLRLLEHKLTAHLDHEDRSDFAFLRAAIDSILALQARVLERAQHDEWSHVIEETAFALDEVIGACVDEIRPLAIQKGLSVAVNVHPTQEIRSDRPKIERVVRNLLANAVRYTKEGEVSVSVRVREGSLELEVRDTGVGIAAENHRATAARSAALMKPGTRPRRV
jgi:signal transduction histidine kinase